jgi:phage terminase large subunit-like protein
MQIFTAEKPKRLRGPQFHRAWIDEPASLEDVGMEMWDMLTFCVRLPGISNHIFVTGTPKRVALMHHLMQEVEKDPVKHVLKTGSTLENKANLSPKFVQNIMDKYDGTNLGMQEIYGKMLGSVEGALWTPEFISHVPYAPTGRVKRIIAIDPAVSTSKKADLTGIIMASVLGKNVYIEKDWTRKVSPLKWAEFVIEMYHEHNCDAIIYEGNLAGALLKDIFNEIDAAAGVPIRAVRAKSTKQDRATPVAALYQKGRVFHVGDHPELERQMTTWTPNDSKSPDRIDALVHAVTYLGLGGRPYVYGIPGNR